MIVSTVILSSAAVAAAEPAISFTRDIKPILSNNCFQCHGPDASERKGGKDGLRLDTQAGAHLDQGGYSAIVPGKPEASALVSRVASTDPDEQMPPPSTGKKLSPREIELLTRWVREGGKYEQHWAYVKPVRPEPPAVKSTAWPRSDIDRFLLARLEREGLAPAPEADRYALARRLSLDLTGLPPTIAEVDAFVADKDPQAYEKFVDRLLAKESYGEHWARMWLDLARYADSAGYADDPPRTIWLFRDYVIRSLNRNKPFDQFTIEQIAGDLLPNPTEEQLMATAFHRNTLTNNEGGTNDEEFRNVAIVDRVNTTFAVWMGTTIACAQCHNHKYDPISQEEFFKVFAIFNQSEDADRRDESPLLSIYTDEQQKQRAAWQAELAKLEAAIKTPSPEVKAQQVAWEKQFSVEPLWRVLKPSKFESAQKVNATITETNSVRVPLGVKHDTYTVHLKVDTAPWQALRIEALTDDMLPGKGPGHLDGNFILSRAKGVLTTSEGIVKPVEFKTVAADYSQPGFEAANVLTSKDPKKQGWAVGGQTGQPHAIVLVSPAPVQAKPDSTLTITLEFAEQPARAILGHFRISVTEDAKAADWGALPNPVLAALKVPADKRTPAQQSTIEQHYLSIAPSTAAARTQIAALQKQLADSKPETVPIMRDMPKDRHRVTKIQHRGNFLDLGEQVVEGTPAVFPALETGRPHDRLALAHWLVSAENPLTARVIANRYWEQLFGIGIVATSEEFGSQGELPFHPELLDWLATELVRQKWDMKAFLKLLVTSAAYRQSSRVTPELMHRDPDDRLLARGPRFRLSAEMVRDQSLAIAGLLSSKMYGPPVKPPQPSMGLSAAFGSGIDWQTSAGEDKYRRGLYTTWRRSNPYPSMATFDAPNREVCTLRRVRTNTPLQALVTLNDPAFVEAAQALARRVVKEGGATTADRARYAFRLCLCRPPHDAELARLVQLFDQSLARFNAQPDQARKMATEPLGAPPSDMKVPELAAWTVVGNVLMNLDETFMKR